MGRFSNGKELSLTLLCCEGLSIATRCVLANITLLVHDIQILLRSISSGGNDMGFSYIQS